MNSFLLNRFAKKPYACYNHFSYSIKGKEGQKMDRQKLAKQAIVVNTIATIVTALYWAANMIVNLAVQSSAIGYNMAIGLAFFVNTVGILLAVATLVFAIITVMNMKKNQLDGGVLMVVSAAIFLGFTLVGFMIGIVVFILSGMSIKKIKESAQRDVTMGDNIVVDQGIQQ